MMPNLLQNDKNQKRTRDEDVKNVRRYLAWVGSASPEHLLNEILVRRYATCLEYIAPIAATTILKKLWSLSMYNLAISYSIYLPVHSLVTIT